MALEETGVSFSNEGSDAFIAAFEDAGGAAGDFESAVTDAGRGIDVAGEIMTGALRAIGEAALNMAMAAGGALVDFFGDSFAGALEAEQTIARLGQVIESTGGMAGVTVEDAQALANEFKSLAGGSDDAVLSIIDMGLRMGTISAEEMPDFIQSTLDLGVVMGDAGKAAQLMARAQEDPVGVLGALRKAGILVSEELETEMKAMVATGNTAGAYSLLMDRVGEATQGAADTMANTTAGQWAIFQETIADAGETIMGAFLPALNGILSSLTPLIPVVVEMATGLGTFFETVLGGGDVGTAFDNLAGAVYRAFGPEAGLLVMQFGDFITGIYDWVVANWPLLQSTFETVWGAIQGVFQVVSDFVTLTLMPAIASIWGETGAQLPTAQQTFEAVMNGIVVATQLVSDFITTILVPALTTAVDWVVANWPAIQAKIEEVWAVVQPILQAAADFIIGTVIPAFAQAVDWVVANWPTIQANIEAVMAAVQAVVSTVLGELVPFWLANLGQMKAWVDTNWPLIQATIETIINAISAVIHNVVDPLVAFWNANHETIMAVASAIWENIKLAVSTAITAIGAIITITMQLITGDWTGAWTTIQATLTTIWTNMEAMAANSIAAIYAVVSDVLANLKTWWDAKWTEIQNSVTTILASILVTVSSTIGNMVTAFTSIDWMSIGSNIISSIQQGVTNLAGSLAQSAADAAYAAYQAILNALQGGSPMQLLIDAGENTMDSMGTGITNATDDAMASANDAAISISDAFIDPFTLAMMMAAEMQADVFQTMGLAQETFVTTSYDMGLAAGAAYVDPFTQAMIQAAAMQASAINDMTGMQQDFILTSNDLGLAAGQAYIDPFTQAMIQAAAMQQSIASPLVGYDVAPVSTTGASDVRNTTYSTTDSRSYNLNATTDRQMHSVQSEFSTMQTLAGLS